MNMKDLLVVAAAAVATVGVVELVGPRLAQAEDAKSAKKAKKPVQPVLKAKGLELSLRLDKTRYAKGEVPKGTLVVKNTTKKAVSTKVKLQMLVAAPMLRVSRRMQLPTPTWSKELTVTVPAGETKTFALETATAKPGSGRVVLRVGKKALQAARFSGPGPQLALNTVNPVNNGQPVRWAQAQAIKATK